LPAELWSLRFPFILNVIVGLDTTRELVLFIPHFAGLNFLCTILQTVPTAGQDFASYQVLPTPASAIRGTESWAAFCISSVRRRAAFSA
ncbi:hypothetical protein POG20_19060, partial [Blautia wexlerae]|nr:hypothetical protein [Blautia wexlerae]